MMLPDADHVNTSICPGVSNTTYLSTKQPLYLGTPNDKFKNFWMPNATLLFYLTNSYKNLIHPPILKYTAI